MRVLGLGTGADSGAAIIEDGRILAAVNEERICRMKLAEGFPRGSIQEVLRLSGTRIEDLSGVLVGSTEELFVNELHAFKGWLEHWDHSVGPGGYVKKVSGKLSRYRRYFPFMETAYYAMLGPSFRQRRTAIERVLKDEFEVRAPVGFVDHHFAHITSAYYTSGFEDALVVSIDGGGDRKSAMICAARNGRIERLHEVSAYNSLGNYYAYSTILCGFQAHRHEGKVTGLAAHGEPKYVPLLRQFIDEENGTFVNRGGVVFTEAIRELKRRLPADFTREDLASSIQHHFEDAVVRLVTHWAKRTGLRNVALAGGVFANVRVNQEVHEIPGVDRIFVHPGMSDGGLSVGAALAACVPGTLPQVMRRDPEPLEHVYLGTDMTEREIEEALSRHGLTPESLDGPLHEEIAELLMQGHVVARADGPMEYGPRALGNRSILYQPADRAVNDWLNERLHRTEFMPFAPAALHEYRDQCFENVAGAAHAAEFMTVTFDCTPFAQERMPGVVHIDGTARPQLVRREKNPDYYRIIDAFRARTGLPAVINTSFNMHEEPIVRTADDCVRAFLTGRLDYIALGPHLIRHPEGITHPLVAVPQVEASAGARD